ncbi:MAG: 30S ribosomal protein S2, partial [Proteobacteria bacterium]|nr:30S ribosomal protein S2 [Pseudomonadota bacterium]
MPTFSMRQLLEAGVHFGHNTRRWNPKMASYLFGVRNSIHIIDLQQTVPLLHRALAAVSDTVANGGRVLFVGTKRQATDKIADAAKRCGQYYVNHRWLGGMMTNWRTISNSITRLRDLDAQLAEETVGLTKKELLRLTRERDKLDRALGGIKEMGGLPDILFVIDTNKEAIAVAEANKLGIPVAAVIDSNSNPEGIDYPIPGNDDAIRAIGVYCDLMVDAVLAGIQKEVTAAKGDVGELEEIPPEKLPEADAKPKPPAAEPAEEKAETPATDEKTPAAEEMPAAKEPPPAEEKPTVDEPPAVEPVKEKAKEPPTDEKTTAPDEKPAEEKAEKPAPDEKPAEEKVAPPAAEEPPRAET